jgi:hypothetical protein
MEKGYADAPNNCINAGEMKLNGFTNSGLLEFKIRLASSHLDRLSHDFWAHPQIEYLLSEYYPHLHSSMGASVAIFAAARDRARSMAHDCPIAERLVPYLTKHIREERAHPGWLLKDMEELGIDHARMLHSPPIPELAILLGTQYYWIHHAHPVSVLAYILVIEGNPPSTIILDRVVARTGLSARALRTFYKHAIIDVQHGAEVRELLDSLPLTEAHRRLLGLNAITCIDHLSRLVERLLRTPIDTPASES